MPCAGRLWVITHDPNKPVGFLDKPYEITPDHERVLSASTRWFVSGKTIAVATFHDLQALVSDTASQFLDLGHFLIGEKSKTKLQGRRAW
jgi:hypothetical protein